MADTKITALTAITTVDPAVDVLPIVDVSDTTMAASGTTKKITSNQILGAGGTATLASATITGDLTVDTNVLKVDSANNRVGIRTASPAATLSVVGVAGTGNTVAGISGNTDSGLLSIGNDNSNGAAGTQTWTGSAQSYAAAISFGQVNTTGVREQIRTHATVFSTNIQSFGRADLVIATKGSLDNNDPTEKYRIASDGVATWSNVGGVAGTAMTLNSAGLGVGVTPSAWSSFKVLQVGSGLAIASSGVSNSRMFGNTYYDGAYKYMGTGRATQYEQDGYHAWYISASGTAGNAVTFTPAMTLDASGKLMVGWTTAPTASASLFADGVQCTNTSGGGGYANLAISGGGIGIYTHTGVAGSETYTERVRVKGTGQTRFVPLAADPSGAEAGDVYYNSVSNKLKCYNGTTWNDLF